MKLAVGALLLTFATAITAGFFVYQFMFTLTEKMKTTFPPESLTRESVNINSTCITISVRNLASANVRITEAYINGKSCRLTEDFVISPNSIHVIHLQGTYEQGETYTVEIFNSLGSSLTTEAKYG